MPDDRSSDPGRRSAVRRLARAGDDLRHGVLTIGSRTPTTPRSVVRRARAGSLRDVVGGRVVLVTGASSGIGEATALRLGEAGATVVLVARRRAELDAVRDRIVAAGGAASSHPCDLTDPDAVDALVAAVLADHGAVDVLVNNAGRSIRRPISASHDRLHDFERMMEINYHAAVRLTMGLLPTMRRRGRGHVVNVLSEGLLLHTPKFAAYLASKAALDEFSRCVAGEVRADGVRFTGVHMPLVRTPMIAPTAAYRNVPALRPHEGAALILEGIVTRAYAVTPRTGNGLRAARAVAPELLEAAVARVAGQRRFDPSRVSGDAAPEGLDAATGSRDPGPHDPSAPEPSAARSAR
ncbi:MAG: SDR family NAD(P)-dependent oxidoreductase [Solirubrobacteraceae bacterium]|nr:SDR family NAD(P)-dependent oxidoreductase [Solirubrobacteraceae bacterium]